MKENKILYKFLKIIYSSLLKILYMSKAIWTKDIPKEEANNYLRNEVLEFLRK